MKSVIIATKNAGKAKDFERILKPYGVEVKTLLDFPSIEDVEETGKTFEENAILKAEAIAAAVEAEAKAIDCTFEPLILISPTSNEIVEPPVTVPTSKVNVVALIPA